MATLQDSLSIYFPDGMDSGTNPELLLNTQYYQSMNTVNRGGLIQTRPGFSTLFGLPCSHAQGIRLFKPTDEPEYLVMVVDGKVYLSQSRFEDFYRLDGIQFDPRARFVVFANATQTTFFDSAGNLQFLDKPRNVLMMQDGFNRAAFWDGRTARHLNPTPSNTTTTLEGLDETPIGLWMEWAGNRLWVSRGNQVFASDFGNPLKFTETQYLAEGRSFYMPEEVTGMVQPTAQSELIVFGEDTKTTLQANILDRTEWLNTKDFQVTDFNIGCVAGKSIIKTFGQTWWFSKMGLVNLNSAQRLNDDSRFTPLDNQMAISKFNISPKQNIICGGIYENYILMSVPSGDKKNRHTWCLDQLPVPGGSPAWNSIWTGIRPVEWTSGLVEGEERIFCLSQDFDGVNRVWEAFMPERADNGCPITCSLETSINVWKSANRKRYRYSEIYLEEILGDVDFAAFYAGRKGSYRQILDKRMIADPGIFGTVDEFTNDTTMRSYKAQTRTLKTSEAKRQETDCDVCGIESDFQNFIDTGFSNLFVWSGQAGIRGFRMFADVSDPENPEDDNFAGACEEDEEGTRILTQEGCGSFSASTDAEPFTTFDDAETVIVQCDPSVSDNRQIGVGIGSSIISEKDANKKAICAAVKDALRFLDCDGNETGVEVTGLTPNIGGAPLLDIIITLGP